MSSGRIVTNIDSKVKYKQTLSSLHCDGYDVTPYFIHNCFYGLILVQFATSSQPMNNNQLTANFDLKIAIAYISWRIYTTTGHILWRSNFKNRSAWGITCKCETSWIVITRSRVVYVFPEVVWRCRYIDILTSCSGWRGICRRNVFVSDIVTNTVQWNLLLQS